MKRFFPLILAITIGLSGYLYFNQKVITKYGIEKVIIYTSDEYKAKKPSPSIKLEKQNLIDIIVDTINSSETLDREINVNDANYVLDVIYSKDKKETFFLWINENTTSAMYQNKSEVNFHIVSKEDTIKLKTLIFR